MNQWKTWESKNYKYITWFKKEPSKVFEVLWDLIEKKTMELVPSARKQEDILLDVGCGDGRYLISSIINKGYRGIGIDPNKEVSLIPAKRILKEAGLGGFLIKSVGESIPLQGSTVSVAFCNSALDHALEPGIVLNEVYRTLKENGILVLWQGIYRSKDYEQKTLEQETHLRIFTKEDLLDILEARGFSIDKKSFLGCNLALSSESYKSVTSRFPQFLNRYLLIPVKIYLFAGNVLPKYASIALIRSRKGKRILRSRKNIRSS